MVISSDNKRKAQELLLKLNLDEKIAMIHGAGLFRTGEVKRLGIPSLHMSDGPMGVRMEFADDAWMPAGNTEDYVSYLPSNSAITATFSKECAYESGKVLGEEARGRGKDVILAPGINIKRSPLNGRNFEYMSEDPYLTAEQCVPLIQGIQESDVAACVKHYAVNSQETERLWVDVKVSERALREIYLPAFKAAVSRGKSLSLMGAYNLVRGQHCCESKLLLNQILREEWGYDGVVVSDWGAVHRTKETAESGLDIEMSVTSNFDEYFLADPLKEAIEKGEVSEKDIDEKVSHILGMMFELNMFEEDRKSGCYNTPEHRQKVLETARESMVLLKNENGRLPLKKEKLKKLLVIGQNADKVHSNGGGSAEIKALYEISPLMGLKSQLGGNCEVKFVKGYLSEEKGAQDGNWQESSLENGGGSKKQEENISEKTAAKRKELLEEAVALAKEYDQVIFVGGLNHDYDLEGQDRADMKLPYGQEEVIDAVLAANPETILVFVAGSPVQMGSFADRAKAIVWSFYAGMEGGNALAEVLLGKVNPSGKLPETFPYSHEDCSAHCVGDFAKKDLLEYREGIYVGYRYYEKNQIPVQFPFGHGLSYTDFEYASMEVEKEENGAGLIVNVSCLVKNTGDMAGKEVLQLYVAAKDSAVDRPVKELKGYEKTELKPGETKKVNFALNPESFAYFDEETGHFRAEAGCYEILIGASLTDIRLKGEVMLEKTYEF